MDADLHGCVEFGVFYVYHGHAHALARGDGVVTRGDGTHHLVAHHHIVAMTGYGTACQFYAHNLACQSFCLLLGKSLLADEVLLVEFHEHAKASLQRSDVVGKFIAVKRQANLKPQCVAATKGTWLHTMGNELVPCTLYVGMASVHLETILARVARAAHDESLSLRVHGLEGIECQILASQPQALCHHLLRIRSLQGYLSVDVALVHGNHIESLCLSLYPGIVLIDIGGIDDEEELVVRHLVDKQIVHGAAILMQHHAIVYLAHGSTGNVVGEDVLHELLRLGTAHQHLAHVAHVEHAACLAHGIVLVHDVGVLDGHLKAPERHHLGTQCNVLVVKTCSFISHSSVLYLRFCLFK